MDHRIQVVILQHPQEENHELSTARLAHLALKDSKLGIGLSWANLEKAVGKKVDPKRWVVLHLSGQKGGIESKKWSDPVQNTLLFQKKGGDFVDPHSAEHQETLAALEGIVILDGNWKQAKALWWRNAWLLKLRRASILPKSRSLYADLRREPRRECLSSLESLAIALEILGEPPETSQTLTGLMKRLLEKKRSANRAD